MAVSHRIPLCNRHGQVMGWLQQDWFYLPELIEVRGKLFFRTGPSGAHKYELCADPYVVREDDKTIVTME